MRKEDGRRGGYLKERRAEKPKNKVNNFLDSQEFS